MGARGLAPISPPAPEVTELVVADSIGAKAKSLVAGLETATARAVGLDLARPGRGARPARGRRRARELHELHPVRRGHRAGRRGGGRLRGPASPSRATRSGGPSRTPVSRPSRGSVPRRASRTCSSRHAADWLDELEEAHVSWASFRTIAPSRGPARHDPLGALGRLSDAPVLPERPLRAGGLHGGLEARRLRARRSGASASTTSRTPR